jgi:hypothetical protein
VAARKIIEMRRHPKTPNGRSRAVLWRSPPQRVVTRDRAAVVATSVLQMLTTVPDYCLRQQLEQLLRDEFALTPPQGAPPIKSKAPVSAKDNALESFDAHVLELLQLIKGQKPQRFAKSVVPKPLLGDLADFLREVIAVRKFENDPAASADVEVAS